MVLTMVFYQNFIPLKKLVEFLMITKNLKNDGKERKENSVPHF